MSYEDRFKKLEIISIEERRCQGDLICMYKIINNHIIIDISKYLSYNNNNTRGHKFKLNKRKYKTDVAKFTFFNRVVNQWNVLPPSVVNSNSINEFKVKLKKFRKDHTVQ